MKAIWNRFVCFLAKKQIEATYERGYRQGVEEGYEKGYRQGYAGGAF